MSSVLIIAGAIGMVVLFVSAAVETHFIRAEDPPDRKCTICLFALLMSTAFFTLGFILFAVGW